MKQIALSLLVIASSGAYVWDQAGSLAARDLTDTVGPADAAQQSVPPPVVPPAPIDPVPAQRAVLPETRQRNAQREPAPKAPVGVSEETTAATAAASPTPPPAASQPLISQVPPPPFEHGPALGAASPALPEAQSFAVTPAVYIPIPQPRPAYPEAPARVIRAGAKLVTQGYADGTYTGPAADAYYGIIQIQALVQGGRLTALKILRYPNDRRTSISINRQALPMLRDEAISAQSANVDIISGATLTSRAFIQSLGGALKKASS